AACKAAVADGFGRMPVQAEMDLFKRKVRGDNNFTAWGGSQDGTVVSDAQAHRWISFRCPAPDGGDQRLFSHGKPRPGRARHGVQDTLRRSGVARFAPELVIYVVRAGWACY